MAAADTLAASPQRDAGRRRTAGTVRLGRRTKLLAGRLEPGEIAVIEHPGLDRVSAEDLIAARVAAVINCAPSLSDSYPNSGPLLLLDAGIALLDMADDRLFALCRDGDRIELSRGGEVLRKGELLATGTPLDAGALRARARARGRVIGAALERFALNTVEHMRAEQALLAGTLELPRLATDFRDRQALVVARGGGYLEDLKALEAYVRDVRPVIVAVDGAVDGVLGAGLLPDLIVGDMDSASESALRCGAELVAHAYLDGRSPGRERLDLLGLDYTVVPAPGTSEDVAMLIAAEKGASRIVSIGSHLNLVEFLDRGRGGASSSVLTRLRLGEILIDATGLHRIAAPGRLWP